MQVAVKNAIFEGATNDTILALLISLTTKDLAEGRSMFDNPLDEPIFYARYFRKWVKEALEGLEKMKKKKEKRNKKQ